MADVEEPDRRPNSQPSSRLFQTTQRAEDVQAWAQRMKDKRAARQAEAAGPAEPTSYWTTDALFEESRQVAEDERLTARTVEARTALLATFGLSPSATPSEVTQAFHELAKLHHPDRYALASPEVQAHHSEAMIRINDAYKALKSNFG
jgi:DnaJ-domain-containing protein 1